MPAPRPLRLALFIALAAGVFLPYASVLAQRGMDETGEGRAAAPTAAETAQIQRDAIEQAAEMRRNEGERAPAAPSYTPFTPQLSVPIPGLTLTSSRLDDNDVLVPFLAEYVSGVYKYLLGISTLVAVIVVIYGGFLYLVGQTVGSAESGLKLIKDAVAGLVVLYASYVILWIVNPNLVNLRPIRLPYVRSVGIGEAANGDEDMGQNGGGCTEAGLRVPNYKQGEEPWRRLPYGPSPQLIRNGNLGLPACEHSADGSFSNAGCIGTIGQGGCGITSLAVVLGYYGLNISIAERVPSSRNGQPADVHLIDPIDTAIWASLSGFRRANNGTDDSGFRHASQFFPQFESRGVTMREVPELLRGGNPLIVGCRGVVLHTTADASDTDAQPRYNTSGHFFVLNGVRDNNVIQIQDVGSRRYLSVKLEDLERSCSAFLVRPRAGAEPRVSRVWGGGSQPAVTVTMELQGAASGGSAASVASGGQCAAAPAPASAVRTVATGGVERLAFTYRPSGGDPAVWPDNSASVFFPSRLRNATRARVHAFIFLHGDNGNNRTVETSPYVALMQQALQTVAGSKDVVIMTPHHMADSHDAYQGGWNIANFYAAATNALHTVMPGATIIDVVVGGHSGATDNDANALLEAVRSPLPGLRGLVAYDGYLGDDTNPQTFRANSGVALYLSPDMGGGMGSSRPNRGSPPASSRGELVRTQWNLSTQACPPCASSAGSAITCYGPQASYARQGGGELISFETHVGHRQNVLAMTNIALCAFYH